MPSTTKPGKNGDGAADLGLRGSGHPNKLLIRDYAEPKGTGLLFRAETEIRLTAKNRAAFAKLRKLLNKRPSTRATNRAIVRILHDQVDRLRDDPEEARKAKNMFSAAFDVLPRGKGVKPIRA